SAVVPAVRPNRRIRGMSAILLPLLESGEVDWEGFDAHVVRTFEAGLTPAINMDTGYGNLIPEPVRAEALRRTSDLALGREFLGGAFVSDQPGASLDERGYFDSIEQIQSFGGSPILFQSFGLAHVDDDQVVKNYQRLASACDRFYGFELGTMFAPFGKIYPLDVFEQLMTINQCVGAKHSSLSRSLEWERLALRDQNRPEFLVLTGNDLAIDMVMYGSDYLLGLSTFAPDAFSLRDAMWLAGDPQFYELNDLLQYLGAFSFRAPVPAYKHDAAMFLKLRDQISTDHTFPGSPQRDASDREVLQQILADLELRIKNANTMSM
ncbi:MAG: dihydrodipicolinate synthase family protein, partial [Planctomycetota bacterium]